MQLRLTILQACAVRIAQWRVPVPNRTYWRLYWNRRKGAQVVYGDETVALGPSAIVLIAPHTHFRVCQTEAMEQLFVHFAPAPLFTAAAPGLHRLQAKDYGKELRSIWETLPKKRGMTRPLTLALAELICGGLRRLPEETWRASVTDKRIKTVLEAMENHLARPLSNNELAALAHLAPTAFVRRFKEVMGESPQAYYLQKRLAQASLALEYSQDAIDSIAARCGFCDRNYFSTVFKKHYNFSPARFRATSGTGH